DIQTGKETIVEMKSAVNVDDALVQQMVEESVEHAFDDLAARRWIEAKLKAKELISATRKGLRDCSNELAPDYLHRVETALERVERLAPNDSQDEKAGDFKALQIACTELDEATKLMAEILMDRAMEALLKKRGIIQ